jgi:hypothetical protein
VRKEHLTTLVRALDDPLVLLVGAFVAKHDE